MLIKPHQQYANRIKDGQGQRNGQVPIFAGVLI